MTAAPKDFPCAASFDGPDREYAPGKTIAHLFLEMDEFGLNASVLELRANEVNAFGERR